MAENLERNSGRPSGYKFDRGGMPAEMGPYLGIVVNNVDKLRSGRLQVYIEEFGSVDANGKPILNDPSLLRTVQYMSPFYGITPTTDTPNSGPGVYPGNQQSYGMWFTPPDVGVKVLCFFLEGDPDKGYYVGCIPELGLTHMVPALGATANYATQNKSQQEYFTDAPQLPVTELNANNTEFLNNPRFFDQEKVVQSFQASIYFQQGLVNDPERGPVSSSSQRESPSTVYGISTPGQPIYNGGLEPNSIRKKLLSGEVTPEQAQVIGRKGGHSLVMDDGDLEGNTSLIRLRTAQGHQITMSDSGNFFYITHANGQTWIEFGGEGTVDVFSTNSVNVRTNGDINLHADRDINMYAGRNVNIKANAAVNIGATTAMNLASEDSMTLFGIGQLGIRSDGSLALKSKNGSWNAAGSLNLVGKPVNLNSGGAADVAVPKLFTKTVLDDTKFNYSKGWLVNPSALSSIVSRAPTHEPYPYHNQGVDVKVAMEEGQPPPPPGAVPVPAGFSVKAK
jgi:hypothetical protein